MEKEILEELKEIKKELTKQNQLVSLIIEKHDEYIYFQKDRRTKTIIFLLFLIAVGIILLLKL